MTRICAPIGDASSVAGKGSAHPRTGAARWRVRENCSVNQTTGVVTNVDYRTATIPVTASAGYNVGDKVTFANGGVTVMVWTAIFNRSCARTRSARASV